MNPPKEVTVSLPVLGLAVGTRALLAGGIALLLADRLSGEKRKAVGWTLCSIGAVTTIPLVWQIFGGCSRSSGGAA
jgi:hypothetical protein